LLVDTDVQFVLLGSGEDGLEQGFYRLAQDFNWKARAFLKYDAAVAQQIYAGCDLFLMPSHFEPCGTSQMFAMRYGALPLVRETGGLADTVQNYDNAEGDFGTGFMFSWQEANALLGTLRWAVDTYYSRPQAWKNMQKRAMSVDFSWNVSAQKYIEMYQQTLERHKG
jgi:starch synthase